MAARFLKEETILLMVSMENQEQEISINLICLCLVINGRYQKTLFGEEIKAYSEEKRVTSHCLEL